MLEVRGDLGLAPKARDGVPAADERAMQDLERHRAAQGAVLGAVNGRLRTLPQHGHRAVWAEGGLGGRRDLPPRGREEPPPRRPIGPKKGGDALALALDPGTGAVEKRLSLHIGPDLGARHGRSTRCWLRIAWRGDEPTR